jgi:cell division protein ZapA (FtsZ GTPase activity inhibitor)/anti-sigma regulatory factor (Ser/Thr protein kinase)
LRLRQILINLVGNALKFTESGKITLSVEAKEIKKEQKDIVIKVADEGIGIAAEDQQKIFEAFQQVDNEDTRSFEGTGLGLSITMRLAKMLGGTISVEREEGKGSEFTVVLPVTSTEGDNILLSETDSDLLIANDVTERTRTVSLIDESLDIVLSSGQKEHLTTIVTELGQIMEKEWEVLQSNPSIKNVRRFISSLSAFNANYQLKVITEYIAKYREAMDAFDISEFKILSKQFPHIVKSMEIQEPESK